MRRKRANRNDRAKMRQLKRNTETLEFELKARRAMDKADDLEREFEHDASFEERDDSSETQS